LDPVYPVIFVDAINVKNRGVGDVCMLVCDRVERPA
jgi:hypothetical protein